MSIMKGLGYYHLILAVTFFLSGFYVGYRHAGEINDQNVDIVKYVEDGKRFVTTSVMHNVPVTQYNPIRENGWTMYKCEWAGVVTNKSKTIPEDCANCKELIKFQ